jgi:hypothetical protein
MKKILVIGSGGAGKSTFAKRLGGLLGINVIHLDALYWQPGWIEPPKEEYSACNPAAVIAVVQVIVKLTFFCLLAGLPLGLAGWLRRERMRWLSVLEMISSLCLISYLMVVRHFTAGGPHGD